MFLVEIVKGRITWGVILGLELRGGQILGLTGVVLGSEVMDKYRYSWVLPTYLDGGAGEGSPCTPLAELERIWPGLCLCELLK